MKHIPLSQGQSVHSLSRARSVIEDKFVELGRVLENAVTLVGDQIDALDQLNSVLNVETVEASAARISAAAEELNNLAAGRDDDRARLQELGEASRLLAADIESMQQSLRYLHVFAVNIKVTAGGVPGAQELFQDFAEEVLEAIEEGRSHLAQFVLELNDLTRLVAAAAAHEADLERRCTQLLPAVPQQLRADAAKLADHHKQVAGAAAEISGVARSLQGKVGGALSGLQIGDTTRQRVEHVETAIAIVRRGEHDGELGPSGAAVIQSMLSAQLEDAACIFDRDVERMAENLAGVATEAQKVLALAQTARGSSSPDGQAGVLARLERSLGEAISLVGEFEKAEATAREVGLSAQHTAAGLAARIDSIRAIKTTINHMAVNAHLKCCRLGDPGRPLSVIAVELRVASDQLGERAGAAEDILAKLSDPSSGGGADIAAKTEVGALLQAAIAPIRDADGRMGADIVNLGQQCGVVAHKLREATERLKFRSEVSDVLSSAAAALTAGYGDAAAAAAGEPGLEETMAEIARLYTMAQERVVHRRFMPPEEAAVAA